MPVGAIRRSLRRLSETRVSQLSIALFLLGFGGVAVSLSPSIVPWRIAVRRGVTDVQTDRFACIAIVVPFVLARQAQAYRVFRGKIQVREANQTEPPVTGARRICSRPSELPLG